MLLFIFNLWYKENFSQNCLSNTFFPFTLIYEPPLSKCEFSFPWIMWLHLIPTSFFPIIVDCFSTLLKIVLPSCSLWKTITSGITFFKISLGVWDGTKPIFLSREIYIFIIFYFAFRGQGLPPFTQMYLYVSQFCRCFFMFVPASPWMFRPIVYPPPLCVVPNELTSFVLTSALYWQVVNS